MGDKTIEFKKVFGEILRSIMLLIPAILFSVPINFIIVGLITDANNILGHEPWTNDEISKWQLLGCVPTAAFLYLLLLARQYLLVTILILVPIVLGFLGLLFMQ